MSIKKQKQGPDKIARSSETGKLVSKKFADANPSSTVLETVPKLGNKQKVLGGLAMIIEGASMNTGMTIKEIMKKLNQRFGTKP